MDVIDSTPFEDINSEETLEDEESDLTLTIIETMEPKVHHNEAIISLHALFSISSR